MDEFKRFVDDHREEFELPAQGFDDLWGNIEQGVAAKEKQTKRISLFRKSWKIAAMLVLTFGFSWLGYQYTANDTTVATNSEWVETEQFYATQIHEKMQLLEASRKDLDHAVFDDLDMLDAAFKELKEDLADNVDNEEVIEAMIQNYRIKLQLLEEILKEIDTNEKKETDELPAA